ncbi:GntR family transcriptional regulator [Microbacterium sp. Bi128]|uniref:GntR family transcriptional regulator n=1 Tax=Microbacterium sp. Bi128 TaxID=2821115 RepID=UPI001D55D031|nr:GntR family transcriptional regulator [Microbacterium sp. Bi128]CAH0236801.1 HTH-type transcriptional repressor YtrA [Microbacterium sp. Bi128]
MSPADAVGERFPGSWRTNPASSVPLFEQLRLFVIERADNGTLAPGTRLPAVRSLAGELGVAPHTVARAYKELELAGLVETRRRNGTVVAGSQPILTPPAPPPGTVPVEVIAAVDRCIAEGRTAGLDDAALLAILRARQGGSHK